MIFPAKTLILPETYCALSYSFDPWLLGQIFRDHFFFYVPPKEKGDKTCWPWSCAVCERELEGRRTQALFVAAHAHTASKTCLLPPLPNGWTPWLKPGYSKLNQ